MRHSCSSDGGHAAALFVKERRRAVHLARSLASFLPTVAVMRFLMALTAGIFQNSASRPARV